MGDTGRIQREPSSGLYTGPIPFEDDAINRPAWVTSEGNVAVFTRDGLYRAIHDHVLARREGVYMVVDNWADTNWTWPATFLLVDKATKTGHYVCEGVRTVQHDRDRAFTHARCAPRQRHPDPVASHRIATGTMVTEPTLLNG